jgi:sulfocyanin
MTKLMPGLALIVVALAGAAPCPAQTGGSSATVTPVTASDTSHKHAGGKHHGHKHLSFDPATKTVTFKLVAGRRGGTNRLNFNGYANGKATLVVPSKSTVVMKFENDDSIPHSAAIISDQEPLPTSVDHPALAGAATKDLAQGLPFHGTDVLRFTAPASGSYRIVSGVAGQARSGMWIRFKVDPGAKTPSWLKSQ